MARGPRYYCDRCDHTIDLSWYVVPRPPNERVELLCRHCGEGFEEAGRWRTDHD